MKRLLVVMFAFVLLVACDKKIDGSSEEKYSQSVSKIEENLDITERMLFDAALTAIYLHYVPSDSSWLTASFDMSSTSDDTEKTKQEAQEKKEAQKKEYYKAVNGKTYKEIVEMAKNL